MIGLPPGHGQTGWGDEQGSTTSNFGNPNLEENPFLPIKHSARHLPVPPCSRYDIKTDSTPDLASQTTPLTINFHNFSHGLLEKKVASSQSTGTTARQQELPR